MGGGFFGLYTAELLRHAGHEVLLCEKEADFMSRASYVNQARVHNGYHYPRSFLTAVRSRANYPRFLKEFPDCVDRSFTQYYAVGRHYSKVTARQYYRFMRSVGADIEPAPPRVRRLFDFDHVEQVFVTEECAFDPVLLKRAMVARVEGAGVVCRLGTRVETLHQTAEGGLRATLETPTGAETVEARHVFNCTYSQINALARRSGLPVIPLKHELTEMALVGIPDELRGIGVTVMCGPFFSIMPFPPRGHYTLSHVRYTPHFQWEDRPGERTLDAHGVFDRAEKTTSFPYMVRDAARYLPVLTQCRYVESLWEVKTVLPLSETDDSRPILFARDAGLRNYHVIMGGKIDNVYDMTDEIKKVLSGKAMDA
ncbi:MAG: FAD-binding oxidoreductase [Deltaproteobacteria bacterium]|nr:FAD-binding oxidoreductase [Deltaproteobacteria bacterium]